MQIADTQEKAKREAQTLFEEYMKMFAPLGFVRGLSDDQLDAIGDPRRAAHAGIPTIEDAVRSGGWICGPPEHVVERLEEVQDTYPGLQQVNVGNYMGAPRRVMLEQLEWFGKEVMPAFGAKVGVGGAADD